MNDLDKQTSRIILLRGALELIANSSDVVFTKAWAQRALERDLEAAQPRVQADGAKQCKNYLYCQHDRFFTECDECNQPRN